MCKVRVCKHVCHVYNIYTLKSASLEFPELCSTVMVTVTVTVMVTVTVTVMVMASELKQY